MREALRRALLAPLLLGAAALIVDAASCALDASGQPGQATVGAGGDAGIGGGHGSSTGGRTGSSHGSAGRAGGGHGGTGGGLGGGGHAGSGHAGSGAQGGGGQGGGGPTGDAVPEGAVSYFQAGACPAGWTAFTAGDGRLLVPTVGAEPGGTTHGAPLASGEDRTHTHAVTGSFPLGDVSYVTVGIGSNGVAARGTPTLAATSDPASTGLPYVQLLACRKVAAAVSRMTPLPAGLQMFFDAAACPPGWIQAPGTQGSFPVGLPKGGPADATFGGQPLAAAAAPLHAHETTTTLQTEPFGITAFTGCCDDGYGANGTYVAIAETAASETGLPYFTLLQCQKQ